MTNKPSIYAVVDPTSGEMVRRYAAIGDDALREAIGRAGRGIDNCVHAGHFKPLFS